MEKLYLEYDQKLLRMIKKSQYPKNLTWLLEKDYKYAHKKTFKKIHYCNTNTFLTILKI